MAQETNQAQAQMLCATGCGFYGNPRNGGMCSVCYKEHLQRRGGRSTPPGEKAASPSGSPGAAVTMETDPAVVLDPMIPSDETSPNISVTRQISRMSISRDTTANDSDQDDADEEEDGMLSKITDAAADESQVPSDGEQTPDKSKKKKRCFACRKKVGLTGFDCRCGNLFCGIHRYSDKHDCPYDYRGAAAAQIRKENPMVMAEKIQKL